MLMTWGLMALATVLLAIALFTAVRITVSQPLSELTTVVKAVADGDLTYSFQSERDDKIGAPVREVEDINQSARKIADIISVIDGIAFQTNILALNAAAEAARTGEQGRGFAVVASEVHSLAGRSAKAAKEIKALIGASVGKVASGTTLVQNAGSTMVEIVSSVQRVSDIIGEITSAASEQSDGIGEVNTAVNQLDQMTQQNAALVEQSAVAAASLQEQAQRLAQAMSVFRLED